MKKYIAFLASGILLMSCSKGTEPVDYGRDSDIPVVFDVTGMNMEAEVETKVTAVTNDNLNTMYVAATSGTGTESVIFGSTTFSKNGTKYTGGKYWKATNPAGGYHFYGSNQALTATGAGATVQVPANTDVVCAYKPTCTFQGENTLEFNHILARCGKVTVNAVSGYTISNVKVTLKPMTTGTYNIKTGNGSTNGTAGWSNKGGETTFTVYDKAATGYQDNNDVYFIPGNYAMTATWTAVMGDYSRTYEGRASGNVQFTGGSINNVLISLGGNATEIVFSVQVKPWENTENKNATFSFD